MASGPRYSVKFKRRREGKTDYRCRLALLKNSNPRMVVRKSSKMIIVQFIEFHLKGDRVIGTAISKELKDLGWTFSTNSIPAAYLTGLLASKRVKGKVTKAVLDIGQNRPRKGSKVFAVLKGAIDGGIQLPYNKDILPSEDRLKGAHIEAYRKMPVPEAFEKVKAAIEALKDGRIERAPKKVMPKKVVPKKVVPKKEVRPEPKKVTRPPVKKAEPKKEKFDDMDALLKDLMTDKPAVGPKKEKKKDDESGTKSALESLLQKKKRKDLIKKKEED